MKLKYQGPARGAYVRDVESWQKPMAKAATKTFREAAKTIEVGGRANISAAGLGRKTTTEFRVLASPRRQFSMTPSLRGYHRRGYINIFERSGTIPGKPLIWIPLPTAPVKIAGKRTTARAFAQHVGPLTSINRPGRAPLLAGQALRAVTGGRRATVAQLQSGVRRAARRRAGGRGRGPVLVPLFVGVRTAHIRKRLAVSPIYDRVRGQLGEIYLRQFEAENKT